MLQATSMDDDETLPLTCPKCREVTLMPVRWVQENAFYTCRGCGASVLIDKDEAMKVLASLTHPQR